MSRPRQQVIEDTLLWVRKELEEKLPYNIEEYSVPTQDKKAHAIIEGRIDHHRNFLEQYAHP